MLKLGMYAIFDVEAQKYDTPFFCYDDVMAKRRFTMLVQDTESQLGKFKNDFECHKLGIIDCIVGSYENTKNQVIIKGNQIQVTNNEISHEA
jgi:hypothetical protein